MKTQRLLGYRFVTVMMVVCVCLGSLGAAEVPSRSEPEYILILHSYHKFLWTDHINEGINSVLGQREHVSVRTEYMDTKWYQSPEYLQQLFDLYRRKYADMKFDVVIVADDNAYDFARTYQASLFHGAPIVFCGVSDFDPEEIRGRPITGMVEIEPYEDMIDCAMTLLPSSQAMYVLADHSTTSQYNLLRIESWASKTYPDLEIRRIDPMTHRQVVEALQTLPDDSFLMMAGWWVDAAGERIQSEEILAMLQESRRPVFWNAEYAARDGIILGGRCVIARKLGLVAGQMADRILDGQDIADIPPITDTRQGCEYIFNYDQLIRFGLSMDNLPAGAEISNAPSGYFEVSREVLWAMRVGLVGLGAVVCILCLFMNYRHKLHKVLQEKEQRYRNLVEVNSDWMWEVDCRGVYTYVSPQVNEILGYEPEELLGKTPFDLMPPQEEERVRELFSQIVKQRDSIRHLKNINLDRDGNEVMLETNGVPIVDKHGILVGYRGIDRDIAQRRRTENKILEQQLQLTNIFKASPVGIGLVQNRRLIRVNDRMCEMTGCSRDELIGQSARVLYRTQKSFEYAGREQMRQLQEKGTETVEVCWRHKDGRFIDVLLSSTPLDVNDLTKGATFTAMDITEQKRIAQQLVESNEYLESLFKASPTGIGLVCDRQLLRVNDLICQMTGYRRDELVGQSTRKLYRSQEDYEYVGREKNRQIQEKGTGTVEISWLRKDGRVIDVLLSSTPLDIHDLKKGVTFTALDITERKQIAQQLVKSKAHLESVIRSAPTGITLLVNRVMQQVNQQFCEITGYAESELLGQSIRMLHLTEEDFNRIGKDIYGQIREKGTGSLEVRIRRKDGVLADILIMGTPLDPDEWDRGITFTMLDITERKRTEAALIESEKRFRHVIESSPMGFNAYTLQPDGQLILTGTNKAAQTILKRDLSKVVGKPIEEAFPELIGTNRYAIYKQIAQQGGVSHLNNFDYPEAQRGAGGYHDIYVFQTSPGKVAVMFLDVTERILAQRSLEFTQYATDHAVEGSFRVQEDAKVVYVNETACRMLGYTREELLEMTIPDVDPNVTMESWAQRWEAIGREGISLFETQHRTKDGRLIPVEVCANVVEYEGKTYHCSFVRDITERKKAREALQESEYKHRMLFTSATDAIVIMEDGQCVECNPRAVELYGLKDASEMIGRSPIDFSPEFQEDGQRSDEKAAMLLTKALAGQTQRFPWVHCLSNGERLYVEVSLNRLEVGARMLIQTVVRDVTEQTRVRRSLEFTQYATDHAVDGAFWIGEDGKLVYVNEAACRMLGYTRTELLAMTIPDLDPNFPRDGWSAHWAKSKKTGKSRFETVHRAKDGRLIPVEITSNFVEYEGQEFHCSFSRDITDRRQMEEILIMREREFRTLAENSPDNIARYDTDCRTIYVNPALEKTLGRPASELLGPTPAESELIDEFREYHEKIVRVLETGNDAEMDIVMPDEGEGKRYYNVRFVAERGPDRAITGVLAIGRDVTERIQTEEALRESEYKHRLLFTSANDAIFIMEQSQFLECNPRAIELYGCERPEQLLTHSPIDFSPEYQEDGRRSDEKAKEFLAKALAGQPQRFPWVHCKLNGDLFYAEVALNCLELEGHLVIQAMVRDVTERRVAEKAREKLLHELRSKNEELESIVFIASHDLRSPLVNIRGFAGELEKSIEQLKTLLDGEHLSPDAMKELEYLFETDIPESLSFIIAGNRKMDVLLNGLLKLSRVGAVQVNTSRLNMDKIFREIVEGFSFIVHEGQIEITIAPSLPDCYGDKVLINQVFSNLIDNAIKYYHPNRTPQIHISSQIEESRVTYCVADNGIGIAPEHINKVFDIFHQLSPDAGVPGEGLGLTIVRRIVARQDGKIWMTSEVGVGTKVFVQLPLA